MSKLLKVLGCQENCPYFILTGYNFIGSCNRAHETITKEDVHNKKPIPDWCPLEPTKECKHDGCNTFKAGDYIWCSKCGAIRKEFETISGQLPTGGYIASCEPGKWMIPKKD